MLAVSHLTPRRTAVVKGLALLALILSPVTKGVAQTGNQNSNATIVTLTGLRITDIKVGTGASPEVGQTCVINYTSWLYANGAKGEKVASSLNDGQPLTYVCGKGQVRKEWDEGIATMKVGGIRRLIAPPQRSIVPSPDGHAASSGEPPGFVFEIELVDVR